jgi:hypothetical protein
MSLVVMNACNTHSSVPATGVYWWQTDTDSLDARAATLSQNGFQTLYLRLFDLDYSEGRIQVVGQIKPLSQQLPVDLIPVVFITIPTLNALNDANIESTAELIVQNTRQCGFAAPSLFQLDADYTRRNQAAYNQLVVAVKKRLPGATMSCTVRLHQLEDINKGDCPQAADHLMLLTYHTGDLQNPDTRNSILSMGIARGYLSKFTHSARPISVALPDFGWTRLYRDGQLIRLLPDPRQIDLGTPAFTPQSGSLLVNRSTWLNGHGLYENDLLVPDTVHATALKQLAASLGRHPVLRQSPRVMYHLSSKTRTPAEWQFWRSLVGYGEQ